MTDARTSDAPPPKPKSSLGGVAGGAAAILLGRVGGRGLHVIGQIILARLLGPAVFGLYVIGWTILRILGLITPLGLENGVVRFGAHAWPNHPKKFRGLVWKATTASTLVSLALATLWWLFAAPLAEHVFFKPALATPFRWFAIAVWFGALTRIWAGATQVTGRMHFSAISFDLAQPLFNLAAIGTLAFGGISLGEALGAATGSYIAAFFVAAVFLFMIFPEVRPGHGPSEPTPKGYFSFSVVTSLTWVATNFTIWIDRLVIGSLMESEGAGIYHAASQISIIFLLILSSFGSAFAPQITRLHEAGNREQLKKLYRAGTRWVLTLSLPIFLVLCAVPNETMQLIFGRYYVTGAQPMILLCAGQIVNAAVGTVGVLLIMTGSEKAWLRLCVAALITNTGMNLLLVPTYGLEGAAVATGITLSLLALTGFFLVRRWLEITPWSLGLWKVGACVILSVAALYVVTGYLSGGAFVRVLAATATGSIAFWGGTVALGIDEEDRELLRSLRKRISRESGSDE